MKFVLSFSKVLSTVLNYPFQSCNPVEEDTLKLVETDRHPRLCQGLKQGSGVPKKQGGALLFQHPVLRCRAVWFPLGIAWSSAAHLQNERVMVRLIICGKALY
jgi:hypothetical protein